MPPQQNPTPETKIKWNQVTWYSRLGSVILFVGLVPALAFYIGTQYQSVTEPTVSIVLEPTTSLEKEKVISKSEINNSVYSQTGRAITLKTNGLSFDLPLEWEISQKDKPSNDWKWDEMLLSLPTGEHMATIVCPAMGEGPYESATTSPILTRTFVKDSITYEADFQEWGSNRIEYTQTESGTASRYLGPPEQTNHVKSVVRPVGSPAYENGCIMTSGNTTLSPETINALQSIYTSWR